MRTRPFCLNSNCLPSGRRVIKYMNYTPITNKIAVIGHRGRNICNDAIIDCEMATVKTYTGTFCYSFFISLELMAHKLPTLQIIQL